MTREIVDSHVHLADRELFKGCSYVWHDTIEAIKTRSFLPSDYLEASKDLSITGCVYLECNVTGPKEALIQEAVWADSLPIIDAVVANGLGIGKRPWAEVEADLAPVFALKKLKGIRQLNQLEPDGFSCSKNYIDAVRGLGKRGLSVDLCTSGEQQLRDLVTLLKQVPDVSFVLNHIGKPPITDEGLSGCQWWADLFTELSGFRNLYIKISGVPSYYAPGTKWSQENIEPFLSHAINTFGWDRVMFGSDWYAILCANPQPTFKEWVSVLESSPTIKSASKEQQTAFFSGNAKKFYRI